MIRDLRYEAAFLRAALLLGLVRESEIPDWAAQAIECTTESAVSSALAEILSTPTELSAMREALYPLARRVDGGRVLDAVFVALSTDRASTVRPMAERLRTLELIRHDLKPARAIADKIRDFTGRAMLAAGNVPGATMPDVTELGDWLKTVTGGVAPVAMVGRVPYLTNS